MLADEADGVAVVHHHHRVVFLRQVADASQVGDDAVHREHAVGGDQPEAARLGLLQLLLERRHVVVGVAEALGLGEPDAVDDRGVVQRVRNDRVLFDEQRLEQAAIGVEAGAVEDRVLHAEEARDPRLELLVLLLRAADEAHRGHAVAVAVERGLRRLAQLLAVGEAEIVVGAEVRAACGRQPRSRPTGSSVITRSRLYRPSVSICERSSRRWSSRVGAMMPPPSLLLSVRSCSCDLSTKHSQDALEVAGIVCVEERSFARQVQIPETR